VPSKRQAYYPRPTSAGAVFDMHEQRIVVRSVERAIVEVDKFPLSFWAGNKVFDISLKPHGIGQPINRWREEGMTALLDAIFESHPDIVDANAASGKETSRLLTSASVAPYATFFTVAPSAVITRIPSTLSLRGWSAPFSHRRSRNIMNFCHRDPTVPFWRSNVDIDSLFAAHSHRTERAQAWLRYRQVSESCCGFERATIMKGHFEGGILGDHTFHWTFTPGLRGDLAIVIPVFNNYRLADLVAVSRHDHNVWGCCTGAGLPASLA
jgi:hypothetical protein